jgi:hypothetical protein
MRIALRLFSVAFIVVEMGIYYSMFALDVYWPDQAVDYWEWQAAQPLNNIVAMLPYASLVLVGISMLSAVALLFRFYAARWVFVVSLAIILIIEGIVAFNVPPQLVGAEYLLNEVALLLAGIVGALAFCVVREDT